MVETVEIPVLHLNLTTILAEAGEEQAVRAVLPVLQVASGGIPGLAQISIGTATKVLGDLTVIMVLMVFNYTINI